MLTTKLSNLTSDQRSFVIAEMRNWVLDCQWMEGEDIDVSAMPEKTLLYGVEKHYSGGIDEFVNTTLDYIPNGWRVIDTSTD